MIAPVVVFVIFLFLALEGLVLLVDQIQRVRAECRYWDVKASRPELYDWERDL